MKELEYSLYVQMESDFLHEPFENENFIYDAVIRGDIDTIVENRRIYGNIDSGGKGVLSDDPLKNELYHMIINTAVIARKCMAAGLPHETAYTLSDIYIKKADSLKSVDAVKQLNDEMTLGFAGLMRELLKGGIFCRGVRKAVSYICENLHRKLTTAEIAEKTGYDRTYLCLMFKKETGYTISDFIRKKRLDTAANMLKGSEYSCSRIADALGFSSQSHFSMLFRKAYGVTPGEYRRKNS